MVQQKEVHLSFSTHIRNAAAVNERSPSAQLVELTLTERLLWTQNKKQTFLYQ